MVTLMTTFACLPLFVSLQVSVGSVDSTTSLQELAALIRQKKVGSPTPIAIPGILPSVSGPISPRSAIGFHFQVRWPGIHLSTVVVIGIWFLAVYA